MLTDCCNDKEDISSVLKEELENGHGVDVAIDCLGGEIMGKCIQYLTHGARWIMIAALAGQKTEIDLKKYLCAQCENCGKHAPFKNSRS